MAKRGGTPRGPGRASGGRRSQPSRGSGRASGSGGRSTGSAGPRAGGAKAKRGQAAQGGARDAAPATADTGGSVARAPFRLGAIPGATPGKWIDTWHQRMPGVGLDLVPLTVADQRRALVEGEVDAALVRVPIDTEGLHVIPLYDELPVVVTWKESHLTAADELDLADLAGEVIVTPGDDVLAVAVPGGIRPSFDPPADTGEAIAIVATGVGVVIVPMSLARLHHRKDAGFRPLRDGPTSTVALAWPADRTTAHVEAFVGIVRGRTANSSRS